MKQKIDYFKDCFPVDITRIENVTPEIVQSIKGMKVIKKSERPFKSTFRIATVRDVIEHPIFKGESAFLFEEDDSYVSVCQCTKE